MAFETNEGASDKIPMNNSNEFIIYSYPIDELMYIVFTIQLEIHSERNHNYNKLHALDAIQLQVYNEINSILLQSDLIFPWHDCKALIRYPLFKLLYNLSIEVNNLYYLEINADFTNVPFADTYTRYVYKNNAKRHYCYPEHFKIIKKGIEEEYPGYKLTYETIVDPRGYYPFYYLLLSKNKE